MKLSELPERIQSKATEDENGCWMWSASTSRGYGYIRWEGKTDLAHRVTYRLAGNSIPDGYHVDHLCKEPLCINPAHLEAVTPTENWRRSDSISRILGDRDVCKYGHPLTPENLVNGQRKQRRCRTCNNRREQERRDRKCVPEPLPRLVQKVTQ